MNAISAVELTRRFGQFVAVDRVSFDVHAGEIFGFLGSNGAGKSTTIRMLCGLLKPTSGTATVGGIDVGRDPEGVKRRIGYMSQRFSLYEQLTVDENIRFFGGLYGLEGKRLEDRRAFVLEMAGLRGREKMRASELAGGWRQRLALGCSILHEPPILFLDEPTGGVDPLSRREFWNLIDQLSTSGVTVLVTTHYLDEAEHCHRIAIIHAGKLAALGSTRELKGLFDNRAILEIRAARPVDAMRLLDAMDEVEKTSVFGTAVHAVLKPGHRMPSARSPIDCRRPASRSRRSRRFNLRSRTCSSKSRIGRHDWQPRVCRRAEGAAPDCARQADARDPPLSPGVLSAVVRFALSWDLRNVHIAVDDRDHSPDSRPSSPRS